MSRMKTEQVSNNEQKIIENGQLNLNLIKKSYTLTMKDRLAPNKAVKYATQRSAALQLSHRNPIPCKAVIITSLIWF